MLRTGLWAAAAALNATALALLLVAGHAGTAYRLGLALWLIVSAGAVLAAAARPGPIPRGVRAPGVVGIGVVSLLLAVLVLLLQLWRPASALPGMLPGLLVMMLGSALLIPVGLMGDTGPLNAED